MLIQFYTFSSSFDSLRSIVLAWLKNGRDDEFGRYPPYITIDITTRPAPTKPPITACVPLIGIPKTEELIMNKKDEMHAPSICLEM